MDEEQALKLLEEIEPLRARVTALESLPDKMAAHAQMPHGVSSGSPGPHGASSDSPDPAEGHIHGGDPGCHDCAEARQAFVSKVGDAIRDGLLAEIGAAAQWAGAVPEAQVVAQALLDYQAAGRPDPSTGIGALVG